MKFLEAMALIESGKRVQTERDGHACVRFQLITPGGEKVLMLATPDRSAHIWQPTARDAADDTWSDADARWPVSADSCGMQAGAGSDGESAMPANAGPSLTTIKPDLEDDLRRLINGGMGAKEALFEARLAQIPKLRGIGLAGSNPTHTEQT